VKVSNLTSHNSFSDETITPNSNSNSSVNSTNLAVVDTSNTTDVSYNQPNFDSYTVWNSNGITFTDNTTIKSSFYSIFIDKYDTIYIRVILLPMVMMNVLVSSLILIILYTFLFVIYTKLWQDH